MSLASFSCGSRELTPASSRMREHLKTRLYSVTILPTLNKKTSGYTGARREPRVLVGLACPARWGNPRGYNSSLGIGGAASTYS